MKNIDVYEKCVHTTPCGKRIDMTNIVKSIKNRKLANIFTRVFWSSEISFSIGLFILTLTGLINISGVGLIILLLMVFVVDLVGYEVLDYLWLSDIPSERFILKTLENICNDEKNLEMSLDRLNQIVIIPKNLTIGENLDGRVAQQIFQRGHYIIAKDCDNISILRQYEKEDKFVLEELEELDLLMVKKDLPDVSKKILKLEKRGSKL